MTMPFEPRLLHGRERRLVTPIELFQTAEYATGTVQSGAQGSGPGLSGYGLHLVSANASAPAQIRLLNAEMHNAEPQWLEVEFRDGLWSGARVMGPFRIEPFSRVDVPYEKVVGRYFTSSVFVVVLSGGAAQPLSNGVFVRASYVDVPVNYFQ